MLNSIFGVKQLPFNTKTNSVKKALPGESNIWSVFSKILLSRSSGVFFMSFTNLKFIKTQRYHSKGNAFGFYTGVSKMFFHIKMVEKTSSQNKGFAENGKCCKTGKLVNNDWRALLSSRKSQQTSNDKRVCFINPLAKYGLCSVIVAFPVTSHHLPPHHEGWDRGGVVKI